MLAHKLGSLAAVRRRAVGKPVLETFAAEARAASVAGLSAAAVLRRVREVADGPLLLLKGPEVAAHYPLHGRWFGDVDVLTPDASGLHLALREHGFLEVETPFDHSEHHHLAPLRWPVVPFDVEVHATPNSPYGMKAQALGEIVESAVPSVVAVDGVSAPCRLHHAVILAAHAWAHEPLQTLRDLLDVAVLAADESSAELERVAGAWGLGRVWGATQRAIEDVFFGGRRTVALATWARHLAAVRERTVFESHLQAALHPFWGRPPGPALVESLAAIGTDLFPARGEDWDVKLRRIPRAIRDARAPRSGRAEQGRQQRPRRTGRR